MNDRFRVVVSFGVIAEHILNFELWRDSLGSGYHAVDGGWEFYVSWDELNELLNIMGIKVLEDATGE